MSQTVTRRTEALKELVLPYGPFSDVYNIICILLFDYYH